MTGVNHEGTFWDHLDELRGVLLRSLAIIGVAAVAAFCMKDWLFGVVLAPRSSSFVSFRLMGAEPFELSLMNTGLTEQFMTHMRVALYAGLLAASPWVIWQLFGFIAPGLYARERRIAVRMTAASYAMFILGTLVCYFVVFPLTVRFLGTYQVSPDVTNMLTLQSYVDTLVSLTFAMGAVFQLPVVCALLSRMGLINRSLMRRYRRHAIVAILIVAAIITPTTDVMTLAVVSLPIWGLYEISVWTTRAGEG